MRKEEILNLIVDGLDFLIDKKLPYISGKGEVLLVSNDRSNERFSFVRGDKEEYAAYSILAELSFHLASGRPIHVDTVLGSGGNARTVVETVVCYLPNVGYMPRSKGRNETSRKVIQWFPEEVHSVGEAMDVSDASFEEVVISLSDLTVNQLPKPFLLLAGISGTGKSRFVRQQAERNPAAQQKIISVRPDWHEPSDLLGYISRLSADSDQYIVTDTLRFIFSAWQAALGSVELSDNKIKGLKSNLKAIPPYWLGLDEMNLAPVEQYFADYLSVIESRKWAWEDEAFTYSCEPLLSAEHCQLIKDKKLRDALDPELWAHFEKYGMPIPFNLIVAGTVNMDETTHGFSRKVIDRALTIDYGEFAPNTLEDYFEPKVEPRVFSYPTLSSVRPVDLEKTDDKEGKKSIAFLNEINGVLKDTPFELAYRALNELLISVACEKPPGDAELQAVWDDFLMTKVLPRIEGDADKLEVVFAKATKDDDPKLLKVVKGLLTTTERKDLFLQGKGGGDKDPIALRSPTKIKQMVERLDSAGFTSFWP